MTIDVSNRDGSELPPDCLASREWMVKFYHEEIIPLRVFSDRQAPRRNQQDFSSVEDAHQVLHFRECGKCHAWMYAAIPEKWITRQGRLARYCCPQMFVAVEEPKSRGHSIQWHQAVHPDNGPFWSIDGKTTYLAHCPWCGAKMPSKPFVEPLESKLVAERKPMSAVRESLEREMYDRAKETVARLRAKYEQH